MEDSLLGSTGGSVVSFSIPSHQDLSGSIRIQAWVTSGKYDPSTSTLSTLHTEDYLNTGWQFYGVSHWTGTSGSVDFVVILWSPTPR